MPNELAEVDASTTPKLVSRLLRNVENLVWGQCGEMVTLQVSKSNALLMTQATVSGLKPTRASKLSSAARQDLRFAKTSTGL